MKNSDIYSKVENTLEKIRKRNELILEQRKKEISVRLPCTAAYLSRVPSEIFGSRGGISPEDLESLRKRSNSSAEALKDILADNGYPRDYLEPISDCPLCADTGFAGRVRKTRCSCFYVHSAKEIYGITEFSLPGDISFETFDATLFDGFEPSLRSQKKEYMSSIKDLFVDFCQTGHYRNYYLFGKTGTGKTFFMVSTAKKLLENGIPSLYLNSNNLFRITQEYKASRYADEKPDPFLYSFIYNTHVLLIDELGSESVTPSKYSELLEIINQRSAKKKSTVIASNLSPLDIKKMYDERVYSRIIGVFDAVRLPGDDLRLLIKRRENKA